MNISGKTILITGASSGLGMAVAIKCAGLNAKIILVCRDYEKGEKIVKMIKSRYPNANPDLMTADLSSYHSTMKLVSLCKERYDKLDILINNAAILKQQRTVTGDGLETMFQTNFLSPVILMNAFIPLLSKSKAGRIINISLPSTKLRLDFNNLQFENKYKPFDAFFKTKLALLLYSLKFAQIHRNNNVAIICAVPGSRPFKSGLGREASLPLRFIMKLASVPVEKVVDNMMYSIEYDESNTGLIFKGKKQIKPVPYWQDENIQNRLYEITAEIIDKLERINNLA